MMLDEVTVAPAVSAPPAEGRPAPLLPTWAAFVAAAVAGPALLLAFPPYDLWPAAPVGVAVLAVACHRRRARFGALLGLLTGLGFLIPLLSWTDMYVGPVWLILPGGEAGLFFTLLGACSALVSPVLDRWRWTAPLVIGGLWAGQEALRDRVPFGGFPWGRLAFSQADSPLLRLASLGGAPLVTAATAAIGGLLFLAVVQRPWSRAALAVGLAALLYTAPLLVPRPTANGPTVTVAIVQGNVPRLGLDFNSQRRAVLDNHIKGTLDLAAQVAAGTAKRPDLVVWPENASDIDPIANPDASTLISQAAAAIGAPILVGGLLDGPRNVGIVWLPGSGPAGIYVKQHPVPFAEYIPLRRLARLISDKVDLVRADFLPGDKPGVLTAGPVTLGDVICFEVAYDNIVRDTVTGGAGLLVVQTNNATFNNAEALQQLAMVRLRAVEHGRPALMASTVGVSGYVTPAGRVLDATEFNTAAVLLRELRLGSGRTMATSLGMVPEIVLAGLAVAALVAVAVMRIRGRRTSGV